MLIGLRLEELPHPIRTNDDGTVEWTRIQGDRYHVTGVDRAGRRFRIETDNWHHARGINVYRGSRWLVRGGRRFLIHRVTN